MALGLISVYTQDMILWILALLPVYAALRLIYVWTRRPRTSLARELLLGTCVAYGVGLLSQTILPSAFRGFESGWFDLQAISSAAYRVNLVPLRSVHAYLFTTNDLVNDWAQVAVMNLVANIGLFVPFGLLLPMVRTQTNRMNEVLVFAMATSVSIEVAQLLVGRSVDIDDVILNVLGAAIGYLLFATIAPRASTPLAPQPPPGP